MAQTVTAVHGDNISKLLSKRGVQRHETHTWLDRVRRLNPHIGNLDRIWPGDRILLPDSPMETVSEQKVWENALSRVPAELKWPRGAHTGLYFTVPGDTIDGVAEKMFADNGARRMPPSTKRAVLLNNNPPLIAYLGQKYILNGMVLNITPLLLDKFDTHFWQGEASVFESLLSRFDPQTQELYRQTGPQETMILALIAERIMQAGGAVGMDGVITAAGYSVGGMDAYAGSARIALGGVNALMREVWADAVKQVGEKVTLSAKAGHIDRMMAFYRNNPKYPALMSAMRDLPAHLVSDTAKKLCANSNALVTPQIARRLRREWLALSDWPSSRYMGTIAAKLNGRVNFFKGAGRATTWYIPAAIGFYNVIDAPPELRMRTLFAEGFGVVGGAVFTGLGVSAGLALAPILCLGPFGAFVLIFILAAGVGFAGSEGLKWLGGKTYDLGDRIGERILYSPDELVGAF
ncbi:MAG: hypothetical protein WAU91_18670 [Desulfatitalea sp.]